jgi:hypothetical protein
MENLGAEVDIKRVWEAIKENIKISSNRAYVITN